MIEIVDHGGSGEGAVTSKIPTRRVYHSFARIKEMPALE